MRSVAVLLFAFAVYAAALPAPEPADEWVEVDDEVDRRGFAKDPQGGLPLKHVFDKGDGMHSGKVTLTYKPLSKRCFKFPAGDSLVAWSEADIAKEGMDPRCYDKTYLAQHTTDAAWKCSGGFPFYRWKALDMTESQCMMYCLSKGMDAFAYVHDGANTGPRDTECRCGATVDNKDIWNGITPPSFLLPPNQDDPLGKVFGRQWRGECFCGNKYGSQGRAEGCKCEARNIGSWKNCVYEVTPGSDPGYTPPPCKDKWSRCPVYKRMGFCTRYSFFPRYCPLSCDACPEEEGGEEEEDEDVSEEEAVHLLQDAEAQEETWSE